MMLDELRGHVEDVLAVASLSDSQTIRTLLSRVNGASVKDMLTAALSVAREQTREIAGLEYALRESEETRRELEGQERETRELQTRLARERKQFARKTREVQEQIKRLARK